MTDKNAITIISGLLQHPSGDGAAVNHIIKKYPYFVPARYIKAAQDHSKKTFTTDMLSASYPYIGNWLMFLDHLQGAKKKLIHKEVLAKAKETTPVTAKVESAVKPTIKSEAEIVTVPSEPLTVSPIAQPEEELIVEDVPEHEDTPVISQAAAPVEIEELIPEITYEPETLVVAEDTQIGIEAVKKEEDIFTPAQSDDYFMQQGIKISRDMPDNIDEFKVPHDEEPTVEKSLMVMMSFTEWLMHFKSSAQKKESEIQDQKAIRTMWQKEKLAAAMEEENEEIPENVFEMAVNSIAKEEGLASESLAEIYMKQGKLDQAVEMYKKLSLRNPQKNAYFAAKIQEILKDK